MNVKLIFCGPLALIALAIGVVAASASPIVLSDGTFNNVTTGPGYTSDASNLINTAAPCLSCGNSGQALQTQFTFVAPGYSSIWFIDNLFNYNPSTQGQIASIGVSVDKDVFTTFGLNYTGPSNISDIPNTLRPLIAQNGHVYVDLIDTGATFSVPGESGYVTLSASGLTASDFSEYNSNGTLGSGHPDFGGSQMSFGILSATHYGYSDVLAGANYDNLTYTISAIPLPGSLPFFVSGLGFLGLLAWKRKVKLQR